MELWDAYDRDGNLIEGTLVRGEPIPDGVYHVDYNDNPERMLTMLEKVSDMRHAEYAYFWVPFTDRMDKVVPFEEGHALMKLTSTTGFTGRRPGSTSSLGYRP